MSAEDKANAHWMQDHTESPYGTGPSVLQRHGRAIGAGVLGVVVLGGAYGFYDSWNDTKAAQAAVELRKLELSEMRAMTELNQVNRPSIEADRKSQLNCVKDLAKAGEHQAADACAAIYAAPAGSPMNTATVADTEGESSTGTWLFVGLAIVGGIAWISRAKAAPTA